MTRQLDGVGEAAHHQVLTCLPPWMENLSFAARWEGAPLPTCCLTLPVNVHTQQVSDLCTLCWWKSLALLCLSMLRNCAASCDLSLKAFHDQRMHCT